jgi:hypothetical protein
LGNRRGSAACLDKKGGGCYNQLKKAIWQDYGGRDRIAI